MSHGYITTEKTAWCCKCEEWLQLAEDQWKPSATKAFKRAGWNVSGTGRHRRWLCPKCDQAEKGDAK